MFTQVKNFIFCLFRPGGCLFFKFLMNWKIDGEGNALWNGSKMKENRCKATTTSQLTICRCCFFFSIETLCCIIGFAFESFLSSIELERVESYLAMVLSSNIFLNWKNFATKPRMKILLPEITGLVWLNCCWECFFPSKIRSHRHSAD